jgi:protein-tyrosine phosphatase
LYIKKYYTVFALDPAAIEAYKSMFDVLLQNETGSVLIHCVHGKDRSGVAAALILSALDVAWNVIEQEYLLSNIAYPGSTDISSLRYYKSVIEKDYGSMEKYLEAEMNLDENDLMALREKYTTD